jgi:hypothetical protein
MRRRQGARQNKKGTPNQACSRNPYHGARQNSTWPTPPERGRGTSNCLCRSRAGRLRVVVFREAATRRTRVSSSCLHHRGSCTALFSSPLMSNFGPTSLGTATWPIHASQDSLTCRGKPARRHVKGHWRAGPRDRCEPDRISREGHGSTRVGGVTGLNLPIHRIPGSDRQ